MRWKPTLAALAPAVVIGLPLAFFVVTKPSPAASALRSGRAVLLIGAMVVGWVVLGRFVLPRLLRHEWARAGVMSAIGLAIVVRPDRAVLRRHEGRRDVPRSGSRGRRIAGRRGEHHDDDLARATGGRADRR
jgi:hypothetical protein